MKIAIGSDHGGFELLQKIKEFLTEKGYEYEDLGASSIDALDDFPQYAFKIAKAVAEKKFDRAILMCGTGVGMCIAANKVKGIRAAMCNDLFTAKMSREHNDANILCMGGRVVGPILAEEIVETWLETEFLGDKYKRRIEEVNEYEGLY
jgi:ribose 5-phosphate isomerase B